MRKLDSGLSTLIALALTLFQVSAQELKIDRPEKGTPQYEDVLPKGWERLDGDSELIRATFNVSGDFFKFSDPPSAPPPAADDPFAEDLNNSSIPNSAPRVPAPPRKPISAREILKGYGVPFGEGAVAVSDPRNWTITVVNTRDALDLIQVFTNNTISCYHPLIAIRTEIYELTSLQAQQVLDSAANREDHRPERDAVLEAVKKGEAKLVASHSLTTTPGQRAKLEDTTTYHYGEGASRGVGTILECEPNSSGDFTLYLNLSLEHHTADPEIVEVPGQVTVPRFHAKSISTSVNVLEGGYAVIGSWKPTGKPEYAEKDLPQIVFVTASLLDE